jgi:hypothetical protein
LVSFIDQLCFGQSLKSKWTTYKFNDFHFSIECPFSLKVDPIKNGKFICSAFEKNKDFNVFLSVTPLEPKYRSTQLKDIPSITQKIFLSGIKGTNLKTSSNFVTISGVPAILTNGTFETKNHVPMNIQSINSKFDVKKEEFWFQVLIVYANRYSESEKMADKIIQSFQILN